MEELLSEGKFRSALIVPYNCEFFNPRRGISRSTVSGFGLNSGANGGFEQNIRICLRFFGGVDIFYCV